MAAEAAKCRDPVRRKLLRKGARKARREFEAGRVVQPRGKVIHRAVVMPTRIETSGQRMSEHTCEKCYDDKWRRQRCRPRGFVTKEVGETAVLTEMLQYLPAETVYEVAYWFEKRFKGECWATEAWKFLRLVFLKKPDAKLEKGLRDFRAIALLSVFSKWYTKVLVHLLHEEKEPIEWRSLHVGAERGVNCEHMQAVLNGGKIVGSATRVLQISHGFYGESGRENSVRRGQGLSGIKDSHLWSPRTRASFVSRDPGRSWFGLLREPRDGVQILEGEESALFVNRSHPRVSVKT